MHYHGDLIWPQYNYFLTWSGRRQCKKDMPLTQTSTNINIVQMACIITSNRSMSQIMLPFDRTFSTIIMTRPVQDTSDKLAPSNSYEDNSTGQPSSKMPKSMSIHARNVNGTSPHTRRQQVCYNPSRSLIENGMLSPWTSSHNCRQPKMDMMRSSWLSTSCRKPSRLYPPSLPSLPLRLPTSSSTTSSGTLVFPRPSSQTVTHTSLASSGKHSGPS